jgi:hypothetical protein
VAADRLAVGGEPAQEPGSMPGASGWWHTWSARRVRRAGRTVAWVYALSRYVAKMPSNRHEGLLRPDQDRRRGLDTVPSRHRHRPLPTSVF